MEKAFSSKQMIKTEYCFWYKNGNYGIYLDWLVPCGWWLITKENGPASKLFH